MFKLEEVSDLSCSETDKLYRDFVNTPLAAIFKILGLTPFDYTHASGSFIYLKNGKKILDYSSSCGVLNLGHNHIEIKAAEQYCLDNDLVDMLKFGNHKLQAVLAHNLAELLPGELNTSFFSVSGAEANEAALKLAARAQSKEKKYYIRTVGSFHGKTHGILPFTESENFSTGFHVGIDPSSVLTVPFNDLPALMKVTEQYKDQIIAIIVEPIQGQDISTPTTGYLNQLVKLCKEQKILSIFDEIKVGLFRCGSLFSFMNEDNATPDILTVSKSLGGGRRAISAMITSSKIYKKAYGKKMDSTLHSSTFSGVGSSCAVAIKTLEILDRKDFQDQVKENELYFLEGLNKLKAKYPDKIIEVRGQGMYLGLKLRFPSSGMKKINLPFSGKFEIACMGSVIRELFKTYGILTFFTGAAPDVLHIMPPLTTNKVELDYFIESMDQLLGDNFYKLFKRFVEGTLF